MALLSAFLPTVRIEAPGAPDIIAEAMVLRAAIDLCERGLMWAEWADPVPFVDGEADYPLTLPAGARLSQVQELWSGACKLIPGDASLVARAVFDWQTADGWPTHYLTATLAPAALRFVPKPARMPAGSTFTARMIYAPLATADSLPDLLAQNYLFEVADGAKGYLLAMAGVPWSNPVRAKQLRDEFEMHVSHARIASEHGFLGGNSTVQSRVFGL